MAPILVTGAAGSTGRTTVKYLLKKGLTVRALVRKEDDRSRQLEAQGAEVLVGDLLDLHSVRRAFEGVKRAYFVYPAAKEAKAEYIVNMSQIIARPDATSPAALNHWIAERVFDWAGTPVTHLRPTQFHGWLFFAGKLIREEDRFAVPFGPSGKAATVSVEDLGELTATLLENPAGHEGKIYDLSGPTELTPVETAAVLSKHLGREIRWEKISAKEFIQSFAGIEIPYLDKHFTGAAGMFSDDLLAGTNDLFEKIIGRPPQSTEDFIKENKSVWEKK